MRRTPIPYPLVALAIVSSATLLAGCTSSAPTPTPTVAVSPTASPPSSASAPAPSPSPSATPVEGQCLSDQLAPSIQQTEGTAGSIVLTIALTNIDTAGACTLQGWPGVSFVQGEAGEQLGAAAEQDRSGASGTVELAPDGGIATVTVTVAQALNYSNAECAPRDAAGLRIYPPGETNALFIDTAGQDFVGCSSGTVSLLTTGAVQPGGGGVG